MGKDSGSSSSTTTAGISGIAGDTSKRTGDNAQGIGKIFDADKVRQEITAQATITAEFGKQASTAVASYTQAQRTGLQEQLKKASDADKATLQKQLDDVNTQERVLNILVGAVTGQGATAVTKEGLAAAADEMRALMIADSKKFAGVVDKDGKPLSNITGVSDGIKGDGFKLGGTRIDLDLLCGPGNQRCKTNTDGSLALNEKGQIQFDAKDANNKPISLAEFLATDDGKKCQDQQAASKVMQERCSVIHMKKAAGKTS
jgi:filamentous hemagglutinin